ncbi:hypothetical protein HMSSN139_36990 [Paenibacillus sp. HMSSN-139]|nr:hypothetical protein HMSSN139_36990 [Paenibacillus sp. HMSSN-139]
MAAWMVRPPEGGEPQFVNAADGEWLPETTGSWDKQAGGYAPPRLAAGSRVPSSPAPIVYTSSRFDPYDNLLWMTAKPLALKPDAFIGKLKPAGSLSTRLPEPNALIPFLCRSTATKPGRTGAPRQPKPPEPKPFTSSPVPIPPSG